MNNSRTCPNCNSQHWTMHAECVNMNRCLNCSHVWMNQPVNPPLVADVHCYDADGKVIINGFISRGGNNLMNTPDDAMTFHTPDDAMTAFQNIKKLVDDKAEGWTDTAYVRFTLHNRPRG